MVLCLSVCVSLLSVWFCVSVSLLSVGCYVYLSMFLYDSLARGAETRASLVKERYSF